ncbi:MAG: hypothetical protein Q7S18_02755 [bacterium]|nr:hypothetical protein [bacterium]
MKRYLFTSIFILTGLLFFKPVLAVEQINNFDVDIKINQDASEKEWAKQFQDIYTKNPSWYNDPSGASFNSIIFVSSLNNFSSSVNSAFSSHPSSATGGGSW